MLFGIVLMFFIFQDDSQWTLAVNMCTNQSTSGKEVILNLVSETDVSGCNCSVKLTKTDNIGSVKTKMFFDPIQFSGCKYKLVISYNHTKSTIRCSNTNQSIFYTINKTDEIKLYLESNVPSQDESTTFEVRITASVIGNEGSSIRLDCFLPTVKSTTKSVITTPNITDVPLTTSTTVTTQRKTTKPVQPPPTTTDYITTTQRSTTKPVQPQPTSTTDYIPTTQRTTTLTSITSTPAAISPRQVYLTTSSTSSSKTGSTRRDDDDDADANDDVNYNDDVGYVIAGVIGGVIGGVIVGVSILIIMCIVKYRKGSKKSSSEIYSTPQHHLPESQYTDLQLSYQNNHHN